MGKLEISDEPNCPNLVEKSINNIVSIIERPDFVESGVHAFWLFRYFNKTNTFKTWGYYHTEEIDSEIIETILQEEIPAGSGTIGAVLKSGKPAFFDNTLLDPRGAVIDIDIKCNHEKSLIIPLKKENDEESETFAVILLFTKKPFENLENMELNSSIFNSTEIYFAYKFHEQSDLLRLFENQQNKSDDFGVNFILEKAIELKNKNIIDHSLFFYGINPSSLKFDPSNSIIHFKSYDNRLKNELFLCCFKSKSHLNQNVCKKCFICSSEESVPADCPSKFLRTFFIDIIRRLRITKKTFGRDNKWLGSINISHVELTLIQIRDGAIQPLFNVELIIEDVIKECEHLDQGEKLINKKLFNEKLKRRIEQELEDNSYLVLIIIAIEKDVFRLEKWQGLKDKWDEFTLPATLLTIEQAFGQIEKESYLIKYPIQLDGEFKGSNEFFGDNWQTKWEANELGKRLISVCFNENVYKRMFLERVTMSNLELLHLKNVPETLTKNGNDGDNLFGFLNNSASEETSDYISEYFKRLRDLNNLSITNQKLKQERLRSAIISILVDSFSHNISAHSLSALQWWFRKRSEDTFEKKIDLINTPRIGNFRLKSIPLSDLLELNDMMKAQDNDVLSYYEILGEDEAYNSLNFSSLMNYFRFFPSLQLKERGGIEFKVHELLSFDSYNDEQDSAKPKLHLPFPLDYAIWPLIKYLRDKGAFWSGVLGDNHATPGEIVNFFGLIWNDFIKNPLYIGTIAHSEGINKINFYVKIEDAQPQNIYVESAPMHLATIDLSIINNREEESIIDNPQTFLPHGMSYSDIEFVRLGKDFKELRMILSDEKYNIYLPGGLVGKHALFTIFENALRNVKHFTSTFEREIERNEGLNFCISIRPAVLFQEGLCFHLHEEQEDVTTDRFSNEEKREMWEENQLFRIGVWLWHSLPEEHVIKLFKEISLSNINSLLTLDGKPRMGGNAQDKVCAAALLLQRFTDAENLNHPAKKHLHSYYYPYSYWGLEGEGENYLIIYPPRFPETIEEFEEIYTERLNKISENNQKDKILKKYFHVWRGAEFVKFDESNLSSSSLNINDLKAGIKSKNNFKELLKTQDNLARFKFISTRSQSVKRDLRSRGVVRIVETEKRYDNSEGYYKEWLGKWIPFEARTGGKLKFCRFEIQRSNGKSFYLEWSENDLICSAKKKSEPTNKIIVSHSNNLSTEEGNICDIRSHGRFLSYLLNNDFSNFSLVYEKEKLKLYEMYETLGTKVLIIDNRLFSKMHIYSKENSKSSSESKLNGIFRELNLFVENESLNSSISTKDEILNNILDKISKGMHIAIIHLSFITDKLGYKETDVYQFLDKIKEKIGKSKKEGASKLIPDNFLLVITTGRGRDTWKNNSNMKEYASNILHIPIESLESAIENAIVYKDDYQLKNNIIKVLFGS